MEVSALKESALPGLRGPAPLLRLQSDERLIALVRRGHHAAFETLVSRYQSRLLAFCRHMLSSKEDAEDVLQEVFAAAFNAMLADEREIHVRPWLYRIARNRSLNHLRRATAIGVDSMDVHFAEGGISTGEKVLKRERFRQLIADVHDLPETQRTALLLREIDALSYDQIAEAMETTIPSVKSLLVRARISLAEAAEARKLSCAEVREQLGEAAEGLTKLRAPARRHLRSCERCREFRKHLKANNVALAVALPVGVIITVRRLVTSKIGAGAGAGHVAGAGGAGASAGAGAAAGGVTAGGFATAGAGAIATKAVAGLAAAALVTAGAVEAERASSPPAHEPPTSSASARPPSPSLPAVVAATPQATSAKHAVHRNRQLATAALATTEGNAQRPASKPANEEKPQAPKKVAAAIEAEPTSEPAAQPVVTEVVSETTQLLPPTAGASTQATQPPLPVRSGATSSTPAEAAATETSSATPTETTTSETSSATPIETTTSETATSTTPIETTTSETSTSTTPIETTTSETSTSTTPTGTAANEISTSTTPTGTAANEISAGTSVTSSATSTRSKSSAAASPPSPRSPLGSTAR